MFQALFLLLAIKNKSDKKTYILCNRKYGIFHSLLQVKNTEVKNSQVLCYNQSVPWNDVSCLRCLYSTISILQTVTAFCKINILRIQVLPMKLLHWHWYNINSQSGEWTWVERWSPLYEEPFWFGLRQERNHCTLDPHIETEKTVLPSEVLAQWLLKVGLFAIYCLQLLKLLLTSANRSIFITDFRSAEYLDTLFFISFSWLTKTEKPTENSRNMCILPMPVAENKTNFLKWNHEWKIKHKICKRLKVLNRNSRKQLPTEAFCLWPWVTMYYQKVKWPSAEWMKDMITNCKWPSTCWERQTLAAGSVLREYQRRQALGSSYSFTQRYKLITTWGIIPYEQRHQIIASRSSIRVRGWIYVSKLC